MPALPRYTGSSYDPNIGESWTRWDAFGVSECAVGPAAYLGSEFEKRLASKPKWVVRPEAGEPMVTRAVGIPLRSLRSHEDGLVALAPGIFVFKPALQSYRPWWPGFFGNTLIFAATFGLGHVLVALASMRCRRVRGRCLNCGYDRSGLPQSAVCPECGHVDA